MRLTRRPFRQHRTFFERLEITPTVRSYKLILLLAMLDGDEVSPAALDR